MLTAKDIWLGKTSVPQNGFARIEAIQLDAMESQTLALAEFLDSNWELDIDDDAKLRILNFLRANYPKT